MVFRVEATKLDGQPVRRNFRDAAAESYRQQLEGDALGLTVPFQLRQTSLNEHQLRQAEIVYRIAPTVDLEAAVAFYKAHHPQGIAGPAANSAVRVVRCNGCLEAEWLASGAASALT